MTTAPPPVAVAQRSPRVGIRDRYTYLSAAGAAILVVVFGNDAVTRFFAMRSQVGYGVLFLLLPLLALLTRPLEVNPGARRQHVERALASVYAVRNRRSGILWKTAGFWMLWVSTLVGVSFLLVGMGLYRWVSAVGNWAFVTTTAILVWNLFPGRFHLMPGVTFTVAVLAPSGVDRAAYAGLVALDRTADGWMTSTSESGDAAVDRFYKLARGGPAPPPMTGAVCLFFMQPHVWSRFTGDRPAPVDFVDGPTAALRSGRRGILILLPPALAGATADAQQFVKRETQRFLDTSGKKRKKHPELRVPVAVVVDALTVPPELERALEQQFTQLHASTIASYAIRFDPADALANLPASGAAAPVAFLLSTTKGKPKEQGKR